MCHGSHDDTELRDSIRLAGIKGLQGVIRKTVSDDLVENIWEKQHMEKIVPSLLFNMQVKLNINCDKHRAPNQINVMVSYTLSPN